MPHHDAAVGVAQTDRVVGFMGNMAALNGPTGCHVGREKAPA